MNVHADFETRRYEMEVIKVRRDGFMVEREELATSTYGARRCQETPTASCDVGSCSKYDEVPNSCFCDCSQDASTSQ
jgi:hypothetical protein